MSNVNLEEIKDWVAGKDCDAKLHDRIWRDQRQTGCPRCRMFNPNFKSPQTTPQTTPHGRPAVTTIDLTTPPTVSKHQPPSSASPSSSIPIRTPTFAHGTGAYNALAGPAEQKRLPGPANTTKAFLKTSHAGAPAFTFRSETGKKIPAKSEKELSVSWIMHLVTWTPQNYPLVEEVIFLGKPYFYTANYYKLD